MPENKKMLLEIRGMKWNEHCKYANELMPQVKEIESTEKQNQFMAEWVFANVYPEADINDFSYGEVMAIMSSTIAMSTEIRKDEIKNLKIFSLGGKSGESIAETAEKSTEVKE